MARRKTLFRFGNLEIVRPAKRATKLSDKPNMTVSSSRKEPVAAMKGKESLIAGVTGNGGHNFAGMDTGEYLTSLSGPTGRAKFDEMRRSDPQIRTVLNAITLPIRAAKYAVEPASDSPKDREIAEIIERNLLHGMTQTWDDTLRQALLMLPFGFSILEKVWEYRDGLLQIRKLDPRLPTSVVDWKWDVQTDELIGPEQTDSLGKRYVLPIEKLLVFTNEREGDNWEGVSILRPAYKPWYIKSNLEKIDAIKHDRFGVGIPAMTAPDGVKNSDPAWSDAEETLENIQAQEQGYIVKPSGWELEILGGGAAAGTDVLASIKYHDMQIAKSVLAQFVELGSTVSGSRALGQSFVELFLLSLQATANYICEVINRFLIPEYCGYNWPVTEYPRLKASKIQTLDPTIIATLKGAGVLTMDTDTENAVRSTLELPEIEERPASPMPPPTSKPAEPVKDPEEPKDEEDEKDTKQSEHVHRLGDTPPELLLVDVAGISVQLDSARGSVLRKVLALRDEQRRALVDQALAMKRIAQVNVPRKREMYDALVDAWRSQAEVGKAQVKREIAKQWPTRHVFEEEGRKVVDQPELFDLIQDELSLKVEGAGNKLESMIFDLAIKARRAGFVGDALRRELERQAGAISDATWEGIVDGAVNGGWGAGRDAAAQAYTGEIDHVYRSAILDGSTCDTCRAHDGDTWETYDEAPIMPDPECEGGDRCRCINVYVMKAEGAE